MRLGCARVLGIRGPVMKDLASPWQLALALSAGLGIGMFIGVLLVRRTRRVTPACRQEITEVTYICPFNVKEPFTLRDINERRARSVPI